MDRPLINSVENRLTLTGIYYIYKYRKRMVAHMPISKGNSVLYRRGYVGGSDARVIMGEAALLRLVREHGGAPEPLDLSGNLIVQLGVVTECLNRHWFERNTGQPLRDIQRRIRHPVIRWMGATLDGLVAETGAVFEAKFMLPWSFSEEAA